MTITNNGNIDASLNDIITNTKTTNEAVKISFEGFTKGQKLSQEASQTIRVKI